MFMKQVVHYQEKIENARSFVSDGKIETSISSEGISKDELRFVIEENGDRLDKLVLNIAKFLMPGRVSCTSYAAVVSRLMDYVGITDYKTAAGFCLPKNGAKYAEDRANFDVRKTTKTHPVIATHAFIYYDGKYYESYNGQRGEDAIDHIDCVEVESKMEFKAQ